MKASAFACALLAAGVVACVAAGETPAAWNPLLVGGSVMLLAMALALWLIDDLDRRADDE